MRVLVTGAGVRLGAALARGFSEAGHELVLHYGRSRAAAQALAQELGAELLQADLADAQACLALAREAGPVELLINNAAVWPRQDLEQITLEDWERTQAINLRAPFLLTQALLPSLRCVLNIADIGGQRPVPGYAHYSVSKAGVIMLTQALAVELAPRVRVNALSPGTLLLPEGVDEGQVAETIPMGRVGSAQDLVQAALYLAEAPYVTGQVLAIDGGKSLWGPL